MVKLKNPFRRRKGKQKENQKNKKNKKNKRKIQVEKEKEKVTPTQSHSSHSFYSSEYSSSSYDSSSYDSSWDSEDGSDGDYTYDTNDDEGAACAPACDLNLIHTIEKLALRKKNYIEKTGKDMKNVTEKANERLRSLSNQMEEKFQSIVHSLQVPNESMDQPALSQDTDPDVEEMDVHEAEDDVETESDKLSIMQRIGKQMQYWGKGSLSREIENVSTSFSDESKSTMGDEKSCKTESFDSNVTDDSQRDDMEQMKEARELEPTARGRSREPRDTPMDELVPIRDPPPPPTSPSPKDRKQKDTVPTVMSPARSLKSSIPLKTIVEEKSSRSLSPAEQKVSSQEHENIMTTTLPKKQVDHISPVKQIILSPPASRRRERARSYGSFGSDVGRIALSPRLAPSPKDTQNPVSKRAVASPQRVPTVSKMDHVISPSPNKMKSTKVHRRVRSANVPRQSIEEIVAEVISKQPNGTIESEWFPFSDDVSLKFEQKERKSTKQGQGNFVSKNSSSFNFSNDVDTPFDEIADNKLCTKKMDNNNSTFTKVVVDTVGKQDENLFVMKETKKSGNSVLPQRNTATNHHFNWDNIQTKGDDFAKDRAEELLLVPGALSPRHSNKGKKRIDMKTVEL